MFGAEFRASAYRIAAAVFGVLAVALLVTCLVFWNRATRANVRADAEAARAEALQAELSAVKDAMARDAVSDAFTVGARTAIDESAAKTNALLLQLGKKLNDRPPVPDVCPSPDADLVRELAEGSSRFRSAESGLRGLRSAEGGGSK